MKRVSLCLKQDMKLFFPLNKADFSYFIGIHLFLFLNNKTKVFFLNDLSKIFSHFVANATQCELPRHLKNVELCSLGKPW